MIVLSTERERETSKSVEKILSQLPEATAWMNYWNEWAGRLARLLLQKVHVLQSGVDWVWGVDIQLDRVSWGQLEMQAGAWERGWENSEVQLWQLSAKRWWLDPWEWTGSLREWTCNEKRSKGKFRGASADNGQASEGFEKRGQRVVRQVGERFTEAVSQEPRAETVWKRKNSLPATELSHRMRNEN